MKLTKLSNSGRDTYKQCGFKYLLEYEDKVPDKGDRSALNFGSFIHRIFEEGVKAKSVEELEKIGSGFRKEYPFDDSYNGKIKTCLKNFWSCLIWLAERSCFLSGHHLCHPK